MIPKLEDYKKKWQVTSEQTIRPGLDRMREALQLLGHPEQELSIIHVTGTNGKGSTIALMESILLKHGYTTGVFSSPALMDVHDQIRMNGVPIESEKLHEAFRLLAKAQVSGLLTDFELLTAAALIVFQQEKPDFVLMEVGMGGTMDSTNVVTPLVSVITSVALDHADFLGTTLAEIAQHKAGIIKEHVPVVCGPLPQEALAVVQRRACSLASFVLVYGHHFRMKRRIVGEVFEGTAIFQLPERKMLGWHQAQNTAVAIETLLQAGISLAEEHVVTAVASTQLPFRFQEISPSVFVDGSHNPAAAKALVETIRSNFPGERVDFFIGMLVTKDVQQVLHILAPVANSFTFVSFSHPQAASAEKLMEVCPIKEKYIIELTSIREQTLQATHHKKVITGSLYLLQEMVSMFR